MHHAPQSKALETLDANASFVALDHDHNLCIVVAMSLNKIEHTRAKNSTKESVPGETDVKSKTRDETGWEGNARQWDEVD
uniref:Uncharacterized protein n=1 Tax=Mycena chlorophos TaxID=658473 RepID=A0ABQ0KW67_MYCCL|nr:predicted protein [Mycena chlorophos]